MDISYIEQKVRQWHEGESSGHDFSHVARVRHNAARIALSYPIADRDIIACTALLHDVADHKLISPQKKEHTLHLMRTWLLHAGMDTERMEKVMHICQNISFSTRSSNSPLSIEGQIVQDADRLDAMGAIGIARTFAYGGAKGRDMYGEEGNDTVSHFYDKLLRLKDLMNTPAGREMAEERHSYMNDFLCRFYDECGITSKR